MTDIRIKSGGMVGGESDEIERREREKEREKWMSAGRARRSISHSESVCLPAFCLPEQVGAISLEVCPRCGHACLLPLGLKSLEQNCV